MSFTHYKIGARSGAIWTATQLLYKYLPLAPEDVLLITGTPNARIHRTCEKSPYRVYSKAAEVPAGIQEMRILCDYRAVDGVYEPDTYMGTLIWNRSYWADILDYEPFGTMTSLLVRAVARLGIPNVDKLSVSRGVVVDLRKVGNVAESNEHSIVWRTGWNATHQFVYLTMDHALHDRMIDKNVYAHCINVGQAPWSTFFAGLKEFNPSLTPAMVANAVEAEVAATFNLPVTAGKPLDLIRDLPNGVVLKAAARDFIENGMKERLL